MVISLLLVVSGQFNGRCACFYIPYQNEAVLGACSKQRFFSILVNSLTPLDRVNCAATAIKLVLRLAIIRTPNTNILVVGTTRKELAFWIPLNLLDYFFVTLPSLDRTLGLVCIPQVDELTLTCNSHVLGILPFYFEPFKFCVE